MIAAIGPLWSWHEVWLVAAGGTFVLAFPELMAVSFPGFYLALWMVLWSFVLRGISIEVGGHINDSLWRSGWDFVFAVSNVLLAILFGTALGNVIRGVPIDGSGMFSMSLFTDFTARGRVGILDWYTLSVAVFATVLLSAHGATYLRLKTVGPVHERSERLARLLWLITAALFVVVSVETSVVRPELFQAMLQRPLAWMSVVVIGAAVWALCDRTTRTSREPSLCRVVRRDRRPARRRRGEPLSRGSSLDSVARTLDDGVFRCDRRTRPEDRAVLVAGCRRPRVDVLLRHHAHLLWQGAPVAGHSGLLRARVPCRRRH